MKPPPQQYDDAILRNQRRMQQGQVSGATATDSAQGAENQYSSSTVNNPHTDAAAQGADQSVTTIDDPTADKSSGWVPPSQRGVQ